MAYKRQSPMPIVEGGTGDQTITAHGIVIGAGTSALTTKTLTNGQLLIGSTGLDPVATSMTSTGSTIAITVGAGTIDLETGSMVATSFPTDAGTAIPSSGALTVAGGTNIGSTGAGSTITLNLDSALTGISSITTSPGGSLQTGTTAGNTTLLRAYNNTGSTYDTFATLIANLVPTMDLNSAVTINSAYIYRVGGTDVAVADGGTGSSSLTAYSVLCGGTTTTSPVQSVASLGSAGQVLTSNGAAALPTWQPAAAGGLTWSVITADLNPMVVNNGYVCNKAGLLTLTLPSTSAAGSVLRVTGMNTDVGWRIAQGTNQKIHFTGVSTTTGAGGYVESTLKRNSLEIVCVVADLEWNEVSSTGNLTIV